MFIIIVVSVLKCQAVKTCRTFRSENWMYLDGRIHALAALFPQNLTLCPMDWRLSNLHNRSGHNGEEIDPNTPAETRSTFSEVAHLARGIKQSDNNCKPFKNYVHKWHSAYASCFTSAGSSEEFSVCLSLSSFLTKSEFVCECERGGETCPTTGRVSPSILSTFCQLSLSSFLLSPYHRIYLRSDPTGICRTSVPIIIINHNPKIGPSVFIIPY
jgi:hypothetical protein